MRIFCAIRHSSNPGRFYGGLWSANFYPALRQLGHEVVESQVDLDPASRFMDVGSNFTPEELALRDHITGRIVDELRAAHAIKPVDLFLSYFYNSHFAPRGFAEVRALGIPSVNFFCNAIHQFPLIRELAPAPDFAWHAEREARASYLATGAHPVWVQMAADPDVYRPRAGIDRLQKACFVGMRYADRGRWIHSLIEHSVPVDLYGPGWNKPGISSSSAVRKSEDPNDREYLGRRITQPGSITSYLRMIANNVRADGVFQGIGTTANQIVEKIQTRRMAGHFAAHSLGIIRPSEIADIFARYAVVLNFSNVWRNNRPGTCLIPHVRLRDFEGPMCRTCYITGHTDEIEEFFDIGKEIETYRTREEFVDKVEFYLGNPDSAERLREAGYRRALRDHKWTNRFEELFRKIGVR